MKPRRRRSRAGAAATSPLTRLLESRLIVCVGNGGVGKTTLAAALAVAAADHGCDTAVITVDPARRLKDALGLDQLSTQPRRVKLPGSRGRLDALALDTKRTFDDLIRRVSPSEEIARRILANRLYQELSSELGGSTEYMAMEQLHALLHRNAYLPIIVDTPPGAHTSDLLAAPVRLTDLLASSAVRFLRAPAEILSGTDSGWGRAMMKPILRALQRWTGLDLLGELADFAGGFEHLVDGFRERAHEVESELRRPTTRFLLVTTTEADTVEATLRFSRELLDGAFPVGGIIANRVYDFPRNFPPLPETVPAALAATLHANYADFVALSRRDRSALARLRRESHLPLLARVPILERPPMSVAGLRDLAARFLAGGPV